MCRLPERAVSSEMLTCRDLRNKHESTLGELYHLISRKRAHGSAFPSLDLEDVGLEDEFGSFEEWKSNNGLGIE